MQNTLSCFHNISAYFETPHEDGYKSMIIALCLDRSNVRPREEYIIRSDEDVFSLSLKMIKRL